MSGLFVWKYNYDGKTTMENGYPKRSSDVFPGVFGSIDALFSVSGTVFVLHSSDKVSTFTLAPDGSFRKGKVSLNRGEVLAAGGNSVSKKIKSAFSSGSNSVILVTEDGFYKVAS